MRALERRILVFWGGGGVTENLFLAADLSQDSIQLQMRLRLFCAARCSPFRTRGDSLVVGGRGESRWQPAPVGLSRCAVQTDLER